MWEKLQQHPKERDRLIGFLFVMVGLLFLQLGIYPLWADLQLLPTNGLAHLLLLLIASALATMRSTRPLLALAGVSACAVIDVLYGGSVGLVLILADIVYAACRYGQTRYLRPVVAAGLAGMAVATVILFAVNVPDPYLVLFLQFVLLIVISAWWGYSVRNQHIRSRQEAQLEHTAQTAALRHTISHELHDLVSNRLAVIGLHAEAAKLQTRNLDSPELQKSLQVIKDTATLAHSDLRTLMNTLRSAEPLGADLATPTQTTPTQGDHLPSAQHQISQHQTLQQTVTSVVAEQLGRLQDHLTGRRRLLFNGNAERSIESALGQIAGWQAIAVMRIVDELVHNSAKHGQGDTTISATTTDRTFRIQVRNRIASQHQAAPTTPDQSGPGQSQLDQSHSGPSGLSGAKILAQSLGGTCHTTHDGPWWVATLEIPLTCALPITDALADATGRKVKDETDVVAE